MWRLLQSFARLPANAENVRLRKQVVEEFQILFSEASSRSASQCDVSDAIFCSRKTRCDAAATTTTTRLLLPLIFTTLQATMTILSQRNALLVLSLVVMVGSVMAFMPQPSTFRTASSSLAMAPRFDKDTAKWIPSSPQEDASAGYGPIGSLLRQGPAPFFQRIVNADEYDQAVLKFMAGEQCTRNEAQASMDAYLRNPNDWAFNRFEEQKTGKKVDYFAIKPDQIVLTLVWSAIVIAAASRAAYCLANQESFWAFVK